MVGVLEYMLLCRDFPMMCTYYSCVHMSVYAFWIEHVSNVDTVWAVSLLIST